MFSVSPSLQGRGIGKQLLKAAEEYARLLQFKLIYMRVISVPTELINCYQRHGYKDTGEIIPFIEDGLTFNNEDPHFESLIAAIENRDENPLSSSGLISLRESLFDAFTNDDNPVSSSNLASLRHAIAQDMSRATSDAPETDACNSTSFRITSVATRQRMLKYRLVVDYQSNRMFRYICLSRADLLYHRSLHVTPHAVKPHSWSINETTGQQGTAFTWISDSVDEITERYGVVRLSNRARQLEQLHLNWTLIFRFLLERGSQKDNRDLNQGVTFRKDFGTNNHNFAWKKEEKDRISSGFDFFRDIPRVAVNVNDLSTFGEINEAQTLISSIAKLLDFNQQVLDQECKKNGIPMFLKDQAINQIFAQPLNKEIGAV